jgi:hypothetical protein
MSKITSPYAPDGEPRLVQSVVCFLDLLGYGYHFDESASIEQQSERLTSYHAALKDASEWLDWWKGDEDQETPLQQPFVVKSFTDNTVIGWPIDRDGEYELGMMIDQVADFQISLATKGYFVRGAIAVAPVYIDDLGVFGSGISEAYRGESQLARDPRVILTESARRYVKQHLRYYPSVHEAPHYQDLMHDADGQWFVNYLENLVIDEYSANGVLTYPLAQHRDAISENLKRHAASPRLWAKYEWLARYHNHFRAQHEHLFGAEYDVAIEQMRTSIGKIVDTPASAQA